MGPLGPPPGAQGAQGALFTGDFPIALRGLLGGAREGLEGSSLNPNL